MDEKSEFSYNSCASFTMVHAANVNNILEQNWDKILEQANEIETKAKRRSMGQPHQTIQLETIIDEPDSD